MTSEERSAITNGIWLCQDCAKLIDSDANKYDEAMLIGWKLLCESEVYQDLTNPRPATIKLPAVDEVKLIDVLGHNTSDGKSFVLDFRVQNYSLHPILINRIKFTRLSQAGYMLMGAAPYSKEYTFDLHELDNGLNEAYCVTAQLLQPGEIDRFAVVLSYSQPSSLVQGWELFIQLETNIGLVGAKIIEFWLTKQKDRSAPRVISLRNFKKEIRAGMNLRRKHYHERLKKDSNIIPCGPIQYFLLFIFPRYVLFTYPNFKGLYKTVFFDLSTTILVHSRVAGYLKFRRLAGQE